MTETTTSSPAFMTCQLSLSRHAGNESYQSISAMFPQNLGTLKDGRKVFKVRSEKSGSRWNAPLMMIDSEKVDYESAFQCGADRLAWGVPVHFINISQNQPLCSTPRQNGLRNAEHLRRK
jgi:hypothetical protein